MPPVEKDDLSDHQPTIMVVDDQPQNVKLVRELLTIAMRYKVIEAHSGEQALALLAKTIPDLVLLDVMMPELDGVETCKRIKENPVLADIPIIFLSAADDKNLIVQALESGGVDYVTKPFSRAELLTRVRTHLALKSARDSLKTLAEDKDELLGILTHDLKNHLGGMQMSAQLIHDRLSRQPADAKFAQLVDNILLDTAQMLAFVKEFLANSTAERTLQFSIEQVNLAQAASQTLRQYQITAERKDISFTCDMDSSASSLVSVDPIAVKQILDNLISNAIKFSAVGKNIRLTVKAMTGDFVECKITDEGPGFTDEDKAHMFRRYARLSARPTAGEPSTGLGLSIVKRLVEAMHGRLLLESSPGKGSTFIVRLPKIRRASIDNEMGNSN
ncbi:signal transduction histidine kinase [Prosthecobacter fusiformis]|uniref:histidine kinase n=1 Tax=Prosthecobacter fusiformis TaxID=48464 RepID=A0A4R7RWC8_9BACT|nr:hybrid sensor histidine kinase/response regulator [Prosthecobacter fusiformis]TDU69318.1 signal transduction histidine kinase [Prosthecobacter fusiformis]